MKPIRKLNPGETAITCLLFVFSLVLCYHAYQISGFSGVNTPGTFPLLASGIMAVSSLYLIVTNLKLKIAGFEGGLTIAATLRRLLPLRILLFCAVIVAYMLLLPRAGFIVSSALFLLFGIIYLKGAKPLAAIVVTAVSLTLIYLIFHFLFQIVLPSGSWIDSLLQLINGAG